MRGGIGALFERQTKSGLGAVAGMRQLAGLTGARKLTVERMTTSLRWLNARLRVRTTPNFLRELDWRTPTSSISERMESSGRTGRVQRISSTAAPIMPPTTVIDCTARRMTIAAASQPDAAR